MLGTFPPLRGLSSYCLAISLALADLVRVEFISFKKLYPGFLYPGGGLKEDHSFPAAVHKSLKVKRRLTWYNPFTWLIEAFFTDADLLHAQWWSLPLAFIYISICAVFKLRGKPIVLTVHNVLDHERSQIFETASRWLFKLADHFIVHTEKNLQQMQDHYDISDDRISLIPHGRLDFHVQHQTNRKKIRSDLGIDPQQKAILIFGAVRPYKGIDTALKAFSEVLKAVPQAVLLIAGKLWQKWEPYQNLIDQLGISEAIKTHFDYIPSGEVYKYFESADLVVLPYDHFDSQSGVGSTAVSFHKPLVVTAVGGLTDLVKDHRYIIPPKDPGALARAIIESIKDQAHLDAMAADAKKVAAELSWPPIAQKTRDIYDHLLSIKK